MAFNDFGKIDTLTHLSIIGESIVSGFHCTLINEANIFNESSFCNNISIIILQNCIFCLHRNKSFEGFAFYKDETYVILAKVAA